MLILSLTLPCSIICTQKSQDVNAHRNVMASWIQFYKLNMQVFDLEELIWVTFWGRNILDEKAITKELKHLACEPLQQTYLRLDAIHGKVCSLQVLDGRIVNLINWEGGGLSLSVSLLIELLLRHSWDTYARQLGYIDKGWTYRLHMDMNGWCNSFV